MSQDGILVCHLAQELAIRVQTSIWIRRIYNGPIVTLCMFVAREHSLWAFPIELARIEQLIHT